MSDKIHLEAGYFRLLNLEVPVNNSFDSPIRCSLKAFKLAEAPSFRAVSYTCGLPYRDSRNINGRIILSDDNETPPTKSSVIICDEKPFPVTQNLFNGLHHLRQIGVSGWLWVDAICIDQEDLEERASQVQFMSQIYSGAQEVLVWLGPLRYGFQDLCWSVKEFMDTLKTAPGAHPYGDILDPGFRNRMGLEGSLQRLASAMHFYISCRWFQRTWILQEVVLARQVRMVCGLLELDFKKLTEFTTLMGFSTWGTSVEVLVKDKWGIEASWLREIITMESLRPAGMERLSSTLLPRLLKYRNEKEGTKEKATSLILLAAVLARVRSSKCLDQRDKIYASLGIASLHTGTGTTDLIQVDYKVPVRKLYQDITSLMLEYGSLDLLAFHGQRRNDDWAGLPSWVPDYRTGRDIRPMMDQYSDGKNAFNIYGKEKISYSGCKIRGDVLKCFGGYFTTIDDVEGKNSLTRDMSRKAEVILEFAAHLPRNIHNGRRRLDALWRTIMLNDGVLMGVPAPAYHEKSFLFWLFWEQATDLSNIPLSSMELEARIRNFMKLLDDLEMSEVPQHRIHPSFVCLLYGLLQNVQNDVEGARKKLQDLIHLLRIMEMLTPFTEGLTRMDTGRTLLRTRNNLLSLGPNLCKPGDQIWLLESTHVPFILRPAETNCEFKFVGDCFILDFMHGEIMEKNRNIKTMVEISIT